jgi:hypothetical protein
MVPSQGAVRLSLHPAYPFSVPVYLHPSCMRSSYSPPRSKPGCWTSGIHRCASDSVALPQGSSLRSGLCCPGPSSLNRPHPPHSQAHRDFTAQPLIRKCLRCTGAPRRPMSGSELSLSVPSRHVTLRDPGKSAGCIYPVPSPATLIFTHGERARHFQKRAVSGLPTGSLALRPAELLASFKRLLRPGFRRVGHPSRRRI